MDEALRQFMSNIESTQARDHADVDLIHKYQKLADRVIAAEERARDHESKAQETIADPAQAIPERTTTPVGGGFFYRGTPASPKPSSSPTPAEPAALLKQLAEAQRARTTLEKANTQLPVLQTSNNGLTRQVQNLEKELAVMKRKLKDTQEEVREGKKLIADVQDEMISQGLQLNVTEGKLEEARRENKVLVERWMKEMGGRAERMNVDMGFGKDSGEKG